MKKILLSAAALLAVAPAMTARMLSAEEALSRVTGSSTMLKTVVRETPKLIMTGELDGVATYYVYSDSKTGMILSASDLSKPVLGRLDYPVTKETRMPDGLVAWLNAYGHDILAAEKEYVKTFSADGSAMLNPSPRIFGKVHDSNVAGRQMYANMHNISPLLKTMWDQGAPYNQDCPDGTYTGCVATAVAMVMKYHNWPEKGEGFVTATVKPTGRKVSMTLGEKPFDWANMLDSYTSGATTAQKDAVAYLMKSVGYAVKMNYGTDASGASSNDVVSALLDNFKYDKALNIDYRNFYTDDVWITKLYNELEANRPIIYSGHGSDGGHEFVFDGFTAADSTFHINWGWSGAYNGYFAVTSLVPEGMGTGGNSDGFTYGQNAMFGVQKPVEGSVAASAFMCVYDGQLNGTASGRNITLNATKSNAGFFNMSGRYGTFDLGFSLTDESGTATYYTMRTGVGLESNRGYTSLQATIPSTVADGVYKLTPAYKTSTMDEYVPMRIDPYDPTYLLVTVKGSTITVEQGPSSTRPGGNQGTTNSPAEGWKLSNFQVSSLLVEPGQEFTLSVDITNPGTTEGTANLAAVLVNETAMTIHSEYQDFIQSVTLGAGETKQITFKGIVDADAPFGSYVIGVIDPDAMMLIGGARGMTVGGRMTVNSLDAPEKVEQGQAFDVTASFTNNTGKIFNKTLDVYFCQEQDNSLYAKTESVGNKRVTMTNKSTRSVTFNCTCPQTLEAGSYILAIVDESNVLDYTDITVSANSGVDDIISENGDADARLYDLQGRPVTGQAAPGLYILKSKNSTRKILVK